jgi:hypothetical protein
MALALWITEGVTKWLCIFRSYLLTRLRPQRRKPKRKRRLKVTTRTLLLFFTLVWVIILIFLIAVHEALIDYWSNLL